MPPYERPVNMMFQSYALFPHMTVEQNIAFGLQAGAACRAPRSRQRVAEMLETGASSGTSPSASRTSSRAASGSAWRWRAALVKRPKLLLLDEPLGALDKKLREQTQFELVNIQEQLGVTFIVVTHDQEEAMTLADAHRRDEPAARSCRSARPPRSTSIPTTRFVADFIGSVNMFEGRIVEDEPDHVLHPESRSSAATIYVGHGVARRRAPRYGSAVRPGEDRSAATPPEAGSAPTTVSRGMVRGDRLHGRPVHLPGRARTAARWCASRSPTCNRLTETPHHLGRPRLCHLATRRAGRGLTQ